MNVLSQLYYSTKEKFSNRNGFDELEAECFAEYMEGLKKENKDLKLELKNYKNDYLATENELLKDKVRELENLFSEATQENFYLSDRVEELEQENEINKRLETDDDFYNTKDLDNKQCSNAIDKLTDERDTYKEVINVICDKFNIEHDEAINIIDDIQSSKDNQLERI